MPVRRPTLAVAPLVYLRRGLALVRGRPAIHLEILAVWALPALAAAYLAATARRPLLGEQLATAVLPWFTAVVGTVVVMIAVGRQAGGVKIGLLGASAQALVWVPRYFWTNVHTSVIFWAPVGLLLQVHSWQEAAAPLQGTLRPLGAMAWWMLIGGVALLLHTRTLLAPFLAVHSDLPGTLAALEAWRLSGRHFMACLATFVVDSLPVGLPLGLLGLSLMLLLPSHLLTALGAAAPHLLWAAIQAVRVVLVPALFALYLDLWTAELARRQAGHAPEVPRPLRALLKLTRPLPHPGRLIAGYR